MVMERDSVVQIIERAPGRYDVEDVEFGRVYKWHPTSVLVECGCGGRSTLSRSTTTCGECGMDHAAGIQEELSVQPSEGEEKAVHHPWRYWRSSEDAGIPF